MYTSFIERQALGFSTANVKEHMADKKHTPSTPGPVVSETLLRFDEVSAVVGLRRSAVYDRMSRGLFPAPVRLGARCVRWRATEVQAFIDAQTK